MDPRPVDFSYRRPRNDNLTYQSYGISQSLFHVGSYGKNFIVPSYKNKQQLTAQKSLRANPEDLIHNRSSRWNVKQEQLSKSYIYENPSSFSNMHSRLPRHYLTKSMLVGSPYVEKNKSINIVTNMIQQKNRSRSQQLKLEIEKKEKIKNEADSLSNWTYSIMKKEDDQRGNTQMQDKIYEHQQKPYNIISLRPKDQPDGHRQYPKFSLEDKLIQKMPFKSIQAHSQ